MHLKTLVENELVEDPSSVWLLRGHQTFAYSDGAASERYLDGVFRTARDLSSRSSELESHIKDWTSEYHLSRKRSQLLSGFTFDRNLRVLEVGCGCGAITRYLGENFDSVVSVEGSFARARLARLRTKDLPSVSVICAPFQEIRFSKKFDIIFVIGVFEYSASFVKGDDPYEAALQYYADILAPDGMIVLAIENQFGLKYLNGCHEDHLGIRFEGVEGYPGGKARVRTFGHGELVNRIGRHFRHVRSFYPYPDYKIPDAVLSAEFVGSGQAGELISQIPSRDYVRPYKPLWNEPATVLELARNSMLEFFSNSFLIVAGRTQIHGVSFDQLADLYSSGRTSKFLTRTRIVGEPDGAWQVLKKPAAGTSTVDGGFIRLIANDSAWIGGNSLLTHVMLRARSKNISLDDIFLPCRAWLAFLVAHSHERNGVRMLDGLFIDSIWPNVYFEHDNLKLADQEWKLAESFPLNVLVIRAVFDFLARMEDSPTRNPALNGRGGRQVIEAVAQSLGVNLSSEDFDRFLGLESRMQSIVTGADERRFWLYCRWLLADRPSLRTFMASVQSLSRWKDRGVSLSSRVIGRLMPR